MECLLQAITIPKNVADLGKTDIPKLQDRKKN